MSTSDKVGIETLRKVVRLFNSCNETFNYRFTPEELVKLAEMCWESGWDFYPDQWTERQLHEALKYGQLPTWDGNERPTHNPIPFKHIQDHIVAKYDLTALFTLQQYTDVVEGARKIWGDDVAAFIMDCFMPEGEPVESGYEDSLSHYSFQPTWLELEEEWKQSNLK